MSCCGPACAMPVRSAKGTTPPLRDLSRFVPDGLMVTRQRRILSEFKLREERRCAYGTDYWTVSDAADGDR